MTAKRKTVSFVETYLPAMMGKASALISSEFHQVALAHGFSMSEWRVLACLSDGESFNIGELAELALTKQPTLTRLLGRMEARGEVIRTDAPEDKRITLVRLSPKGAVLAHKLIELAQEHEQRVLSELGFQSAHDLKRVLRQLIDLHADSLVPPAASDEG